jgi:hypothetical protein
MVQATSTPDQSQCVHLNSDLELAQQVIEALEYSHVIGECVIWSHERPWRDVASEAVASAFAKIRREASSAEREANIETLHGLKPLESNSILDAIRGAFDQGIRAIRLRPAESLRPHVPPLGVMIKNLTGLNLIFEVKTEGENILCVTVHSHNQDEEPKRGEPG